MYVIKLNVNKVKSNQTETSQIIYLFWKKSINMLPLIYVFALRIVTIFQPTLPVAAKREDLHWLTHDSLFL